MKKFSQFTRKAKIQLTVLGILIVLVLGTQVSLYLDMLKYLTH
jgi:uncharacterized membrane protein YwzB